VGRLAGGKGLGASALPSTLGHQLPRRPAHRGETPPQVLQRLFGNLNPERMNDVGGCGTLDPTVEVETALPTPDRRSGHQDGHEIAAAAPGSRSGELSIVLLSRWSESEGRDLGA
jgi:hypothetical protein